MPLWLSRATEIEALTVLNHLSHNAQSVLTEQPIDAVKVAGAAKRSMVQKIQIDVA